MASPEQIKKYIVDFGPYAEDIAARTGQKPEVVLGQMANESDYGTHYLNNNPFGISDASGKTVRYGSMSEAADAYVQTMNSPRYAGVKRATDAEGQAAAIGRAGYAKVGDYSNRIMAATRNLQSYGYTQPAAKPNGNSTPAASDTADTDGNEEFRRMTGQDLPHLQPKTTQPQTATQAPTTPTKPQTAQTDTSDTDGNEEFRRMTGQDLPHLQPKTAATEPDTAPTETASTETATTNTGPQHSKMESVAAGTKRGILDVADAVEGIGQKFVSWGDEKYPVMANIDKWLHQYNTPQQVQDYEARRAQAAKDDEATYGDNPLSYGGGRILGNTIATAPVTVPTGSIGLTLGGRVAATGIPVLSRAGGAAIRFATPMAQGAEGSAILGGDPRSGAVAGALIPAAGASLGATGVTANLAAKLLGTNFGKAIAGAYTHYHTGDPTMTLLSYPASVIASYLGKLGVPVSRGINRGVDMLTERGIPGGIGAYSATRELAAPQAAMPLTDQMGNPLQ